MDFQNRGRFRDSFHSTDRSFLFNHPRQLTSFASPVSDAVVVALSGSNFCTPVSEASLHVYLKMLVRRNAGIRLG